MIAAALVSVAVAALSFASPVAPASMTLGTVVGAVQGYRWCGVARMTLIRGPRVHSVQLRLDDTGDVAYREATSRIKTYAPNPGRNASVVYRVLY